MKRMLIITTLLLICASIAHARGLLIPTEPDLPPLAMLNHHVDVTLEDQVAVTKVQQTFRNHTDRQLEATYVFPIPARASVRDFAMWVDGERVKGELLQADKAKTMYTNIVRQTKNPALLDYVGADMLSLKIFPVPAGGDQKVEVSFTAVAKKEHGLVEYVYPLKTDKAAASTLEEFRLTLSMKSQQPIGTIYSPTHEIVVNRENDRAATIVFEEQAAKLDRDFQLYYTSSDQDIGLTAIEHRPISDEDGYVMLLLSPRAELANDQKVPRDIVFVVDTSGSMAKDKKMEQARAALAHCLEGLTADDRFALVSFATTVNRYRNELAPANDEHLARAKGWVNGLYAGGGTAIHDALTTAVAMRSDDAERMFTIVFFTDGQPTVGVTDPEKILADVVKRSDDNTRIFSFGVGDDLNAVFLDQIAEKTRAVNRFVRPGENLEAQVASFVGKINHPVLANLKLTAGGDVQLSEVYPPQLPDLFHGDQLVVLARCKGTGQAELKLAGQIGTHDKQYAYKVDFVRNAQDKPFVEEIWARRKVGYLLDQIRINGEARELVDEVVALAQNYGIATPYTSYLIMPDSPIQLASAGGFGNGARPHDDAPAALALKDEKGSRQESLEAFARRAQGQGGGLAENRGRFADAEFDKLDAQLDAAASEGGARGDIDRAREQLNEAKQLKSSLELARDNYQSGQWRANQVQKLGVELAVSTGRLKNETQQSAAAVRRVAGRNCLEYGGVWIDESFTDKTPTMVIQAQSDDYFRILQRHPDIKHVFALGNHVVWMAPNGTALVIDTTETAKQLTDGEIDRLFISPTKRS